MVEIYTANGGAWVIVDATMTQVAAKSVEITKFPIEDGSQISDHAIRKPDTFRLDGMISNTPARAAPGGVKTWSDNRADTARDALEGMVGQSVTIDTGSKVYESMGFESVEFPRDANTGDALAFSASFTKILTATSEIVALPAATGGTKKNKGKKPTEPATAPVEAKKSVFKAGADWARGRH